MTQENDVPSLFAYFKGAKVGALAGAALFGLFALVPITLGGLTGEKSFQSQKAVEFTFPGVEEGTYPAGIPFALQDVTIGAVLERSYERLNLSTHGVKYRDFLAGVTIEPYRGGYELRRKAYAKRLDRDGLEGPDIELIEAQMRDDLEALHRGRAIIRVALEGRTSLPHELLQQLPVTILEEWSRHAINQRGVLRLPKASGRSKVVDPSLVSSLSFPLLEDYLVTAAGEIEAQLAEHLELAEFASLIEPSNNLSAQDVLNLLTTLQGYQQKQLLAELEARGVTKRWQTARLILEDEKARIGRELERLTREADTFTGITNDYVQLDKSLRPAKGGVVRGSSVSTGATGSLSGDYITLGDGFADRIFDIAETSGRHEFVQETLRKKEVALQAATNLSARLARITTFEARAASANFPTYQPDDNARLADLAAEYNRLWGSVIGLSDLAAAQRQNLSGHLYRLIGERDPVTVHQPLLNKTNFVLLILAVLAGALCGFAVNTLRQIQRLAITEK